MLEIRDEGVCRFCLQTFAGRGIGRHLVACRVKKQRDNEEASRRKRTNQIFHLKISGYKPFWLHLEAKSTATLADLDLFLRGMWLECCGHLSEFTIDDLTYVTAAMLDGWWDGESKSMDVQLKKVLKLKDKFSYEYDFGSTTYLEGQVFAEREGGMREKIRILARNNLPLLPCDICGAEAAEIDVEEELFYCERCMERELGEEYDMTLPVVNSPRMGVCGYEGNPNFDDFRMPD